MNIIESVNNNYCKNCKHLVKFQSQSENCDALAIGKKQGGCILGEFIYFIKENEKK